MANSSPAASGWREWIDRLTIIRDDNERQRLLDRLSHCSGPTVLSFINAHAANLAWTDARFHADLLASDVLLRDGVGIELLLKWVGRHPGKNMNGTDLIPELLDRVSRDCRLAIYGTSRHTLSTVNSKLREMGFASASLAHGFHDSGYYIRQARCDQPDVVVLAMGMPKQEQVARLLKQELTSTKVLIINGGAVIDFMAGTLSRAPVLIQRLRLEWCYRLCQEPHRLWRRYIFGNAIFLSRVLRYRMRKHCQIRHI